MTQRTCGIEGCDRPHSKRRRYSLDDHFFDAVDTQEKAYWLGFITADGCIRKQGSRHQLDIKLMESDAGHLEKFKGALRADYPVRFAARRGVAGPVAVLELTSWHLVESLISLGVTPRKSAIVQPWSGPADLMPHYWRGLVDGDGCIGKAADRNNWSITLCGSAACMEAFAEWAHGICGTSSRLYFKSNIWYWKVAGLAAPQALARELYGTASIYLDRKNDLAQHLLDEIPIRDRSKRTEYCTAEGCEEKATSRNMCMLHYRYSWVASGPECAIDGCTKKRFARDHCAAHYKRLLRLGTAGLT